jgi:UDPglucose--hexose-1-phosphate uridylyltransferase
MPGEQELIISSPRHISSLSELSDEELFVSFLACQERIRHQQSLKHVRHAMLFLNCRSSAGASLSHIHTQLIGVPVISDQLLGRSQRNQEHVAEHGISQIQSLMDWEQDQQERIIFESDHFTAFCPYASRFAFQTWIVPKFHQHHFTDCPTEMRNELASICRHLVGRMEYLLEQPGYNLLLHQAPFSLAENDHWYFELLPRLTRVAGFEWGTDIWVNPVGPETAAKRLRLE